MTTPRLKIAVIGAGISGLGAAWLLAPHHAVTLFEAEPRPGGHARTKTVAGVTVDTGFIVCNRKTYPLFVPLLEHLGVALAPSDMSFAASFGAGRYEYGTTRLRDLLAQPRRALDPSHWRMMRDILRFFKAAPAHLTASGTIGALIDELRLGAEFRDRFLMPISGAIWSTPTRPMADFPAAPFLRFFDNHGLLTVNAQPKWLTVAGGSARYVQALMAATRADFRLGTPVRAVVRRPGGGVELFSARGAERFDRVIFATHAPQALALLGQADAEERAVLGAFRTEANRMVLHSDISFLPRRRSIWSSWNYVTAAPARPSDAPVSLSYWMNRLQPLGSAQPFIVTLNPEAEPAGVHDEAELAHPQYDLAALSAQGRLGRIQGRGGVYYAGAWTRYGFHEDGLLSALRVAQALGVCWPLGPDPWAGEASHIAPEVAR